MSDIKEAKNPTAALLALGMALAGVQKNPEAHGRPFVYLPQSDGSVKIEELERPDEPPRKTGTVTAQDVDSFIAAVNRYSDIETTVIYATTAQPAGFTAVLNDHSQDSTPGWRDHRVGYQLKHSKEWDGWKVNDKRAMEQLAFAYFIEDNIPDFVDPAGAAMLEMALNFKVRQGVSFRSSHRLDNGTVQLEYLEAVEQQQAGRQGNITIPETFRISIPVWEGLEVKKYDVDARFRYAIKDGVLSVRYELVRPHKVVEQAFADVITQVKEEVTMVPLLFGTP